MAVIKSINTRPYREVNCFLVGGQSNADGRNVYTDPATPSYIDTSNGLITDVYAYSRGIKPYAISESGLKGNGNNIFNQWSFAQVALHLLSQSLTAVTACQWTVGDSQLAATPSHAAGSWNSAYDSIATNTPHHLQNLQTRFEGFKSFCDSNGITLNVRGLIWHQGESDNFSPADTDYAANWSALVSTVRTFTGEPNLPIFYGTVSDQSPDYNATIRSAMLNFAAGDSNAYCRDNNDLVGLHWDGAGSVTFGTWVYDTYIANYA
mgnify:CR=1 FL=1